jgi:hypothetical protein
MDADISIGFAGWKASLESRLRAPYDWGHVFIVIASRYECLVVWCGTATMPGR